MERGSLSTSQQGTPATPAGALLAAPGAAFGAPSQSTRQQQQAVTADAAALPSSPEDYVLDAMAAALANFKVASKRYADYVPSFIKIKLLDVLPHAVLQAARADVGGDGLKDGALEGARQLLTEDRGVAKLRTELMKRQKQLECLEGKMREL